MTRPVIEAGDITTSSNNNADTTPDISFPDYVSGDLLIMCITQDDDITNHTITSPANGPNGETLILDSTGSGGSSSAGPATGIIAWVGDDTVSASTLAWAISGAGEQWGGRCVKVLAGEFDASTPLGTLSGYSGNTSSGGTTIATPSWTIGASDGGGAVVVFLGTDSDPIGGTPSGWTLLANTDHGAVAMAVAVRDADSTNSETVASVDYTLTADSSSTIGVVVRGSSSDATANISGAAISGEAGTVTTTGDANVTLAGAAIAAEAGAATVTTDQIISASGAEIAGESGTVTFAELPNEPVSDDTHDGGPHHRDRDRARRRRDRDRQERREVLEQAAGVFKDDAEASEESVDAAPQPEFIGLNYQARDQRKSLEALAKRQQIRVQLEELVELNNQVDLHADVIERDEALAQYRVQFNALIELLEQEVIALVEAVVTDVVEEMVDDVIDDTITDIVREMK